MRLPIVDEGAAAPTLFSSVQITPEEKNESDAAPTARKTAAKKEKSKARPPAKEKKPARTKSKKK